MDALVFTMLMLPGKSVPDRPMSFHVDSPDSSTQMAVFRGAGDVQWMSAPADVDFSPTSYFVRTPWIYSPGRQNALQMLPMSIGMAQPKLSVQPLYTVVSDPSQAPFVLTVPLHSLLSI